MTAMKKPPAPPPPPEPSKVAGGIRPLGSGKTLRWKVSSRGGGVGIGGAITGINAEPQTDQPPEPTTRPGPRPVDGE